MVRQLSYSVRMPTAEVRQAIYGRIGRDNLVGVSPVCACAICDCMCACSQCMDYFPNTKREATKESWLETASNAL